MKVINILFFLFIIYPFCLYNTYGKSIIINDTIFYKSSFKDLTDWENEDFDIVLDSFLTTCDNFINNPTTPLVPQFNKNIKNYSIIKLCKIAEAVKDTTNDIIKKFFENNFTPYLVMNRTNNSEYGIFTGYYLPEINISDVKTSRFKYPIYRRPDNFDKYKNLTREQIDKGYLNNKGLELFYTDDPIDLFFMHIQGSGYGKLLNSNKLIAIGFDGKTQQPYSSIGKIIQKYYSNNLEGTDSKNLKKFLKNNSNMAQKILNQNKSYIFFKQIEDGKIVGAQGVELINLVSLAVDTSIIPLGFPIWLETNITTKERTIPFNRMMISHDTGSAIKGSVRGDIFFGSGIDAEDYASYQYSIGKYYILIPKNIEKEMFLDLSI